MLIGNSFLFLSIPRAASTSFERSCMHYRIPIDYYKDSIATQQFANGIIPKLHIHRTISNIHKLYGNSYKTIGIKREPIKRFISAWKFIIKKVSNINKEYGETLSNINLKEFEYFWNQNFNTSIDLFNKNRCVSFFTSILGEDIILNPKYSDIFPILCQTFQPDTFWHENDESIKWFKFGDGFKELETYVSDMTHTSFQLILSNHTLSIRCNIKEDDDLIQFYYSKINPPQKLKTSII
jgi:hypothetical protein